MLELSDEAAREVSASVQNYQAEMPHSREEQPPDVRYSSQLFETEQTSPASQRIDTERGENVETRARNIRARERLQILRNRVARTRALALHSRRDLRQPQERLRKANANLMRAIDKLMTINDPPGMKDLYPYYTEVRHAQDELGPLEYSYDSLQIQLYDEEQDLEQEEEHFYQISNDPLIHMLSSEFDIPLSPFVEPLGSLDSESEPESDLSLPEHELVQEYLEQVSAAQQMKLELYDLENRKSQLEEEATFRYRHHLPLPLGGERFIAEFPTLYRKTLHTLRALERDLLELRQTCLNDHLFDESQYNYKAYDTFLDEVEDTILDAHVRSPFHAAAQHLDYREYQPDYQNKREYVNSWMLQWVKESPLEALRLREWIYHKYPEMAKEPPESDRWSELALLWWHEDRAGQSGQDNQSPDVTVLSPIESSSIIDLGSFSYSWQATAIGGINNGHQLKQQTTARSV